MLFRSLHWSVNDPELAAIHHRSASELREGLRDAIAGAQRTGEVAEASDPELEALALMTYIDGLTVEAVTTGEMYPPATVRTLLDVYLDRLFITAPRRFRRSRGSRRVRGHPMTTAFIGVLVVLALVDSTSFGTLLIPIWLLLTPASSASADSRPTWAPSCSSTSWSALLSSLARTPLSKHCENHWMPSPPWPGGSFSWSSVLC